VVVYADDDSAAVDQYVADRERLDDFVVLIRSLAARPASHRAPWTHPPASS
jgi:hypothetical protein